MTEAALAFVVLKVADHVVVVFGAWSHGDGVEMKLVADLPGDHVIGAGGVAAESRARRQSVHRSGTEAVRRRRR